MRISLAKWQNQLVAYRGWHTSSRFEATWNCLQNAYVIPWDNNTPIQKMITLPGGASFDHLWISPESAPMDMPMKIYRLPVNLKKTLYKEVFNVGIVRKYWRKDGTYDFSIVNHDKYNIENIIKGLNWQLKKGCPDSERVDSLTEWIEAVDNSRQGGTPTIYGIATSVDKFYNTIVWERKELKKVIAAQKEKEKTVLKNGRCKNLDQAKFASKARKPARGF
tara:strand:- start:68 stop:730 length:663 start_codon:yes stop_codon:yes gene_type:complete